MSLLQRNYADWVSLTRACAACGGCAKGALANENILSPERPPSPHAIVPQAGYLGAAYHTRRILVLGKNPGGGFQADPVVYPSQAMISDVPSLEAQTPTLAREVHSWDHMTGLQLGAITGIQSAEMAYANQILCRTVQKDVSEMEKKKTDLEILRAIYDTCFVKRLKPLVEILEPEVIVVMGKKTMSKTSWPEWFQENLGRHLPFFGGRVVGITYPSFHNNRAAGMSNAQLARKQVRSFFSSMNT